MNDAKPILFNTEMVRAILDGRKAVTRRVVKPQPGEELAFIWGGSNHGKWGYSPYNKSRYEEHRAASDWKYWTPPYHAGDILYVRETWARNPFGTGFIYPTDHPGAGQKWHPSIHMPKEAARIFLRVTDVRVERLQERFFEQQSAIFELRAEGIDIGETCRECISTYGRPCCNDEDTKGGSECGMLDDVRDDFARLWDSTVKCVDLNRYGWAASPWVWRVEFERCEKPEVAA